MPVGLQLERLPSPLGALLLVADDDGFLRALDFADCEARMHRLLGLHYESYALSAGGIQVTTRNALSAYFEGDLGALTGIALKTRGTAFQRDVWTALAAIVPGTTMSYGAVAQAIGRPNACRAVGLANHVNPVAIVVPCHRVIGATGALTGYAGGLARKAWLLRHEKAHATRSLRELPY